MRTTQRKGDYAVAQAIATFTRLGYDALIPLTESASYDLAVDYLGSIKRVQVRYCGSRQVALRRIHSNSKGYVVKYPTPNSYDWLYILTTDNEEYLYKTPPQNRNSLVPTRQYLLNNQMEPASN